MTGTQSTVGQLQQSSGENRDRARQIDSGAWAVFFIWVGVTMLALLSWGWFLVGVGVLILGAQVIRGQFNLKIETFSVAMGVIFLVGGAWELLALPWPLIPIVLILLGAYLLRKAVWS